jgi:hypothetical protein
MRHSSLPFKIHHIAGSDVLNIADAEGKDFCEVDSSYTGCAKMNAEFIVRACNSHDELLAALEGLFLMNEDEAMLKSIEPQRMEDVLNAARDAITKAKGAAI